MTDRSHPTVSLDWAIATLLGLGALGLYLATLAPTVLAGDGGEFQFVPYMLGIAHPTGYPLYCLLGWAWSHLLPVGDVAYRMNLFSAFWAALAVGLLYPTALTFLRLSWPHLGGERRLIAVLVAATFAVTPTLWSQAIIAEVYGLHVFLVVLMLYLLLRWAASANRPAKLLLWAAFCFGLGLTHHRTTLLLAPAVLAFVWCIDRRIVLSGPLLVRSALLVLIPLALYLYLPLRAPHTPYLRQSLGAGGELVLYENTPAAFFDFILGGPFGGSVDLMVNLSSRVSMAARFVRDETGWLGIVLAAAGLAGLLLDSRNVDRTTEPKLSPTGRVAVLLLTAILLLTTVAFNLVYVIGDIYVLYIPAYLVLVLWMGVGVAWGLKALRQIALRGRWPERRVVVLCYGLAGVVLVALPLSLGVRNFPAVDQSDNTLARRRWTAILAEPLPSDAILISNDRNNIMALWYRQYIDGLRPDLTGLYPLITPEQPSLGHILDLALASDKPAYLIKEMPGIEVKVAVEPKGRLWRVTGPASEGEPARHLDLRLDGAVTLVGSERSPRSPRPGGRLDVRLTWQAETSLLHTYHTYVHLVDAAGQKVAQSDHQPGGVYYPTNHWRPGERLCDDHSLELPAGVPEGVYYLVAGMYALSDSGAVEPLGDRLSLGPVAIKVEASTRALDVETPVDTSFDGAIVLKGYDLVQQDGQLVVSLVWQASSPPAYDYTVFVHLLDAQGEMVAQHDSPPQDGRYPTSVWDAGEFVRDEHTLTLPSRSMDSDYWLRIGLYRIETGERLTVDGGEDSVALGPLDLSQ